VHTLLTADLSAQYENDQHFFIASRSMYLRRRSMNLKTNFFVTRKKPAINNVQGIALKTLIAVGYEKKKQIVDKSSHPTRVARCYIFKSIWVNFGGPWNEKGWYILVNFIGPGNGKGWYILWPFGTYYGPLVIRCKFGNLVDISYISLLFGISCQEKSGNPASNF
jgi:hypothetical protein